MFKRLYIILCLALLAFGRVLAYGDSIRVTLLTCSPGQEAYAIYGHTAIRCQRPEADEDIVFNYGVFDMSKPNFVWRFILGQTDYMVAAGPWEYFRREYEATGQHVSEQELNLTHSEASMLLGQLTENCQPENCGYRYNFLRRNCTTMARDAVEQVIRGHILYPDTLPHLTYRQILHRYTAPYPWMQEGIDLLLGAEVDTILSPRAAMFIPDNLMQAFEGAIVLDGKGNQRPLVKSRQELLPTALADNDSLAEATDTEALQGESNVSQEEGLYVSVEKAIAIALALCIFIVLLEAWTKRLFWLWDVLLLLLQGSAGLLLTFMFFFSEHPAVGSNWQIWLLNPIALIGIPLVIKSAISRQPTLWYAFQFTLLALFLSFSPWIPQVFARITVPLALCLLTRPLSYYYLRSRKKTS